MLWQLYNFCFASFELVYIYFWTLTKRMRKKLNGKLHKNTASNFELSKLDEPDMLDPAGEAGMSS